MVKTKVDLPRRFGFWTGWFVVVASMIGSGILTNSGPIVKQTGSFEVLLILWIAGGLLALAGALTMGELASGITRVGGDYAYVRAAFGPGWGFVYGWAMVLLGFAAPIAVVAYTTASYLYPVFGSTADHLGLGANAFSPIVASLLIVLFTLAHCLGHHGSAWVQGATTIFKALILVGFATAGLLSPYGNWEHWYAAKPTLHPASVASGMILVMYAYTGWNGAVYVAGETRDPARLVPRCLAAGCLAVTSIYVLVNLLYVYALPIAEVRSMDPGALSRMAEIAVSRQLGEPAGRAFAVLTSLGVVASLSAFILTGPRIVYAMAEDGLCPAVMGRLHPRTQCPVAATLAQAAFALCFLWSGSFEEVLEFTGYGLAIISTLVIAPIFVLRRRASFQPTFRVPWYPWTPLLFLCVSLALLVGGALDNPPLAVAGLGSVLCGWPVYWLVQWKIA